MNNKNQHIPAGYKSSPLGIIPEDWEVKRLGDVANRIGDGFHGTPLYTDKSDYYFINGNNLNDGKIVITEATKCVPYSEYLKYKKDLTKNTILISINGSIGNIALYNDEKVMLGKSAAYITIPNYKYFYHLLQSTQVLSIFEKELTGSTIRNLSLDSIRNLIVALPSQVEIDNITRIIDLWDTAISKQIQLVEKLTLRKRGLMQQLLTGKKRLKGFEGKWKEVRLGECGKFLSNNTLSREQLNESGGIVQNIHYGDVLIKYPSIIDCSKATLPFINEFAYKESMTDFVKNGDIVIADTAEDETVGKACEVQNIGTKKILAGLHTMLFRPNEGLFSPFFLGYYINSEVYHSNLIPLIQGIKVCSIGKQAIQNTTIAIPSIDEQNAIASVLVNADKEIEIQKQKLTSLQEQKKGLMQVLLTGKRRIK